ncbi:MAG: hypothetical protein F4X34_03365 [Chloroflexi bacterium]|nr:hypothetical protein [Chloroflexota bacterium]
MPSVSEHLEQAERNESLYSDLCRLYTSVPEYTEWEVVAFFYAALHYVDSWLAISEDIHPRNHAQRIGLVRNNNALRPISDEYRRLYRMSVLARYEMKHPSLQETRRIEINEYASIRQHVRSLLGL